MSVRYLIPLLCAVGATTAAAAQDQWQAAEAKVDKSQWVCKYCPYEDVAGLHGEVQFGVGYVSTDSFKFGDYTGLNRKGPYAIGDATLRYRGDNANYWNLYASDLGLDSRRVEMEGGRQGVYKAVLNYSELPKLISDTARTPFSGVGSDQLTLPSNWVRGQTTGTMPLLDTSLHDVDLRTDRKRLGVGLTFTPQERWEYTVHVKHERKEGLKDLGGGFLFTSTLLPEPVDYTTNQIDLGVGYKGDNWSTKLAYYGSFFRDDNRSLAWRDPFSHTTGGGENQLALPPDNEFHQLSLSGNYKITKTTIATARLAAGRMTQNDDFLPYTVNPFINTAPLPRDSLDGKVNVTNFDARLTSVPTPRLHLQADLRLDNRNNKTPQESYQYVLTDSVPAVAAATNIPQSYRRREAKVSGRYRVGKIVRLSAGAGHDRYERPDQAVKEGKENTVWAEVRVQSSDRTRTSVRLTRAKRTGSYEPVTTTLPQDPLIRRYNMANRTRDQVSGRFSYTPRRTVSLGLTVNYANDDYDETTIGLTKSTDKSVTGDVAYSPSSLTSLHAFVSTEVIDSDQAGGQNISTPIWFATTKDTSNMVGFGAETHDEFKEWSVGFDYTYSQSRGEIGQRGQTNFPDLKSRLHSFKAYGRHNVNDNFAAELAYYYEEYDSDDWARDGVEPDTIPSVLTLGQKSPSYKGGVVMASMHYKF